MNKRSDTLPLGEISHGTLRMEDLLPAVLDLCDEVRMVLPDRKQAEYTRHCYEEGWIDSEEAMWLFEEVTQILDNYCKPYTYLGMHEGDGSSLGVWVSDDALRDGVMMGEVHESSEPCDWDSVESDAYYWLWVNDHGNATLYDRDGRVIWEVV